VTLLQARAAADTLRRSASSLEEHAALAVLDRLLATPNGRAWLLAGYEPAGDRVRRWIEGLLP
jgi:hypothetical protein